MRFLADQDIWLETIILLRGLEHEVLTAREAGRSRAADAELLSFARAEQRLLITRDKDFGGLVFLQLREAGGVIFMRISPATAEEVHEQLRALLGGHSEAELSSAFCVVEPHRYRIRRLKAVY